MKCTLTSSSVENDGKLRKTQQYSSFTVITIFNGDQLKAIRTTLQGIGFKDTETCAGRCTSMSYYNYLK